MDRVYAESKLKEYFGHDSFRKGQYELIEAVLSGRDALGIMPTGGGKSVCYQLPAVLKTGIALVVSPLISLMKDQIHALKENGIPAAYINSSLTETQIAAALERAEKGAYKIVYVAPERLLSPRFSAFCARADISLVAVDEAHCVSQWGQDFRPSYAMIPDFIERFAVRPVVAAFTATATVKVRADIVSILRLSDPLTVVGGFDRENLFFEVRHPKKRYDELTGLLRERKGRFGIVYCATRKAVDEVCAKLKADGFSAAPYHAGLTDGERRQNQDDFIFDRTEIIVATNAFGMGIDKSNVSFVIHYNMPKDLESYYQEAGRAGRDGMPADCVLLYSGQDLRTNLYLIEHAEGKQYGSEEQKDFLQAQERNRLKAVDRYCHTGGCLRNAILKYFGETPAGDCGRCGNCLKTTEEADVTDAALKILRCVAQSGQFYGKNVVVDVLRGSKNARIAQARLDRLDTYGVSRESANELKELIDCLIEQEYLVSTDGQYPVLKLGRRADEAGGGRVLIRRAERREYARPAPEAAPSADKDLFGRLKRLRKRFADEQGVPAFMIFHDKALAEMSARKPRTLTDFAAISGVGRQKLERYGKAFVEEITSEP